MFADLAHGCRPRVFPVHRDALETPEQKGAGVFFILLTVTGARRAIVEAIPLSLKKAITAGIGLFIAIIGFVNAGIVVDKTTGGATTVDLGNFADPKVLLAIVGILIITVLIVRDVKAGIFITLINLIGGFAVGMVMNGMDFQQALTVINLKSSVQIYSVHKN